MLAELDVSEKPVIEVLNKIDLFPAGDDGADGRAGKHCRFGLEEDSAWMHLLAAIDAALVADPLIEMRFDMPQSEGAVLGSAGGGATSRRRGLRATWSISRRAGRRRCWTGIEGFGSEDGSQLKLAAQ